MRFVWPTERYDRLTGNSAAVAALITACAGGALALPVVSIFRTAQPLTAEPANVTVETIAFVDPVAMIPARVALRDRGTPARSRPAVNERTLIADTSFAAPARVRSAEQADVPPGAPAGETRHPSKPLGPFGASVGYTPRMHLSKAAQDSLTKLYAKVWDFRTPLPQTDAQRDSAARERYRRAAEAHDEHRPIPITVVGGSVPFSFLSKGPTREQRARDSVINADNLQRLARLAERARAKHDSMVAAKTVARADSNP